MPRSTVGTHTRIRWEQWDSRNVAVHDEGVTLASEPLPTYGTAHSVDINSAGSIVDVAVSPCGHCYLLDDDGRIHRYDGTRDAITELSCLWEATGSARALCVTSDSIYVAGGDDGCVQAISRHRHQTRWITSTGVSTPIALATSADEVYLLDGGGDDLVGGVVSHVGRRRRIKPVVTGLLAPRDLATGPEGTLSVLEAVADGDERPAMGPVLRRFDTSELVSGKPIDATDSIWIAPGGFRIGDNDETILPNCVALGSDGEVLVGVDPNWMEAPALLRYRPQDAVFERQPGLHRGCIALASAARAADESTVYAVDGRDGRFHVVTGGTRIRHDPDTGGYHGTVVTRFDAGEVRTRWDKMYLDIALEGSETEIGVRYETTDDDSPPLPFENDTKTAGVEVIDGIGPTYADRFGDAGIETVESLAGLSPVAAQAIVSVEEFDVSPITAANWIDDATKLLLDGSGYELQAIHGVGPTYAARMRAAGITDLKMLVDQDPTMVARLVSASRLDVRLPRVEEWIEAARELRTDRHSYATERWTEVSPASPREVLLDEATGRYLWIEIELIGTAHESPMVASFWATFPRESYLEQLPAIYQEDREGAAFLERYVSLFESVFDDVEAGIGALTKYMDPQGIPGTRDHLAWLGGWLAVDVDDVWPDGAVREYVARAPELYRMRGTRSGMLRAIGIYLDHVEVQRSSWDRAIAREAEHLEALVAMECLTEKEAKHAEQAHDALAAEEPAELVTVLEHAEVASITEPAAREPFEHLLGSPEGFLVLVHPTVGEPHVSAISRIVASQQPAHARGRTVGLERRVQLTGESPGQLGHHTYLGVNSVLAEQIFTLEDAALGRDTILSGHEPDGQLDYQARLGEDARLS